MALFKLDCVLFDLDGTLVDTAPDLIESLNQALLAHGFMVINSAAVKPFISHGAMAMINHAVGNAPDDIKQRLLIFMLNRYQQNIATHSRFYEGITEALTEIEAMGLKWGVVTNKRERFTLPLMAALNLSERASCIISGDTTANSKPHPEPMLAACKQAGVLPEHCVFMGDAVHDITAGKNANMKTLAALYGYIPAGEQPKNWGADALIEHPQQLLPWIHTSLCL